MKSKKNKIILKRRDYDLLLKYIYSRLTPLSGEYKIAEQLYSELKSAEVHENENNIPVDVIRINSLVEIEELNTRRQFKFRIVPPDQSNLNKQKLSVFKPLGIALMGYRKGQKITWDMPSGKKVFLVKDVTNENFIVSK